MSSFEKKIPCAQAKKLNSRDGIKIEYGFIFMFFF